MCPCGNVIKVYSMNTGECFQRLIGHSQLVTGIAHHPKIKLQVNYWGNVQYQPPGSVRIR